MSTRNEWAGSCAQKALLCLLPAHPQVRDEVFPLPKEVGKAVLRWELAGKGDKAQVNAGCSNHLLRV